MSKKYFAEYIPVETFPMYEAGDDGTIRNKITGRILKGSPDHKGYLQVCLRKEGKGYTKKIHVLVAKAHVSNPNNLPQVNHKDGNKNNTSANNLEWVSGAENVQHAYKVLGRKGVHYGRKGETSAFAVKIEQLDIEGNVIKIWGSIIDAARHYGVNKSSIRSCLRGRCKTIKGFKWRYYEEVFY